MIIPIDEKYRLKSDTNQWMIQKSKQVKDKETGELVTKWDGCKYFSNPSNMVSALAQMMIRESEAQTLVDALAEVDRVTAHLLTALAPVFHVEVK